MPFPYIPEKITVHLGAPDEAAQNVTLPFSDYIKNVASSEIYPTWPESALRANILAQISFALNRVYTEYYRSRGYPFDITNSTATDQSFINGRNIYDTVSFIVDDIFSDYLRRDGFVEPLFAQYCNGTTVTCEGLSQWGSVDLAEQGQNSVDIVKNYYGDDISIVVDAPIRGITTTAPRRNLNLGSTGNDVAFVQLRLNRISNNFPSIPKIPNPNGFYDVATRDAVTEFQSIFDLAVDGIVGRATWYKIQQIYASVKRLNDLSSEGITYNEIPKIFPNVLSPGAEGNEIRVIQYMINYIAQYEDTVNEVDINGVFDSKTEEAVRGFQRTYGIPETGVIDENTYARMFDVYNAIILSLPDNQLLAPYRPYPGFLITLGFDGYYIAPLQTYLNAISTVFREIPEAGNSGVYDEQTRNAVLAVQELTGLEKTGVTNLATWTAIGDLYADIKSGTITTPEQFPGYIIDGGSEI